MSTRAALTGTTRRLGSTAVRLPSPTLVTAAAVVVASGIGVLLGPGPLPVFSVHLAQLALAGAAAFLLDDPAAELTAVAPPPLWLRRAPRVVAGLAVLLGAWVVVLRAAGGEAGRALTFEMCVLVVLALAGSAVVAARGDSEPGTSVASAVVLAGAGVVLVGGILGYALFVSDAASSDRATLSIGWTALGVIALVVLAVANRDPARRRRSVSPS